MEQSDVYLLNRIAVGVEDAFAILYDRYSPLVYGHLRRLLHDTNAADDVLQETFWQVWKQAGTFDATRSSVRGWLLLLARSRAIDWLRRHRRNASLEAAADRPDPIETLAQAELDDDARRIHAALTVLPPEQRQALESAFFAGLTHEEVARSLGIPLGTAKTRIRLALLRLRDALSDKESS